VASRREFAKALRRAYAQCWVAMVYILKVLLADKRETPVNHLQRTHMEVPIRLERHPIRRRPWRRKSRDSKEVR